MRFNLFKRERELTQMWSQHLGSHSFNPREVETGVTWLGEENINWDETKAQRSLEFGGETCNRLSVHFEFWMRQDHPSSLRIWYR